VPPLAATSVPATVIAPCVAAEGVRPVVPKLSEVTATLVALLHDGAALVLPTSICPVVPAAVTPKAYAVLP